MSVRISLKRNDMNHRKHSNTISNYYFIIISKLPPPVYPMYILDELACLGSGGHLNCQLEDIERP